MYQPKKAGNVFLAIKLALLYLPWSNVSGKRLFNVLDLTLFSFWHLVKNIQIPHLKYICRCCCCYCPFNHALIALSLYYIILIALAYKLRVVKNDASHLGLVPDLLVNMKTNLILKVITACMPRLDCIFFQIVSLVKDVGVTAKHLLGPDH